MAEPTLNFLKGFGSFWAERLTVAAGDPVHDEPPDVEHADVVVDVKKRHLVVVLPQDEEEGVHELQQLGEVVPPQDVDDLGGSSRETCEAALDWHPRAARRLPRAPETWVN